MRKKYVRGVILVSKLKTVKLRKPSRDSYNELSEQLIATYPGCGHSCTSDRRLKKNIQKLEPTLVNVNKIKGVRFNWKSGSLKTKDIGLIAQELEKIYPEFVEMGEDGFERIAYDKLSTVLISAVQELARRVELLEKKKLLHSK